ncbi:hypothetical protein Pcinc_021577 [Petrolisthes cinctipes]|uniref:Uncharacterized protein n=1 Tax=Petrolisthes cinctipes TaxID=88211 RepID=A0AAE1FH43_PETCI|nr:hypothetical protein Pcinc_021577 [Petrolisthes cinctipes]
MWCDGRGRHPSLTTTTTTTTTTTIPSEEVAATGSEISPKKAGVYCTTFTANVSMLNSYPPDCDQNIFSGIVLVLRQIGLHTRLVIGHTGNGKGKLYPVIL